MFNPCRPHHRSPRVIYYLNIYKEIFVYMLNQTVSKAAPSFFLQSGSLMQALGNLKDHTYSIPDWAHWQAKEWVDLM